MRTSLLLISAFICSTTFAQDSVKEIPSFYLRPELYNVVVEYPLVIQNGYAFVDSFQMADKYFDHLPPEVNFDAEQVVIFAWNGSGQDKIEYEKIDDVYHFVYKRGNTKDLKQHLKIVSIPKKNDWIFHRVLD